MRKYRRDLFIQKYGEDLGSAYYFLDELGECLEDEKIQSHTQRLWLTDNHSVLALVDNEARWFIF